MVVSTDFGELSQVHSISKLVRVIESHSIEITCSCCEQIHETDLLLDELYRITAWEDRKHNQHYVLEYSSYQEAELTEREMAWFEFYKKEEVNDVENS